MKLRKYGDIFGLVNYATYKEILYIERYLVMAVMANFADMSERYVKTITKSHELWAETTTGLEEIVKCIQAN